MRCRYATAALVALGVFAAAPLYAAPASTPLTLERIMAAPDWIGPPVEQPYWSADGHSLYYQLKRSDSPIRDLYRVDPAGGAGGKVDDAALAEADGGPAVYDRARTRAAFVRHGDVFIRELASGRLLQVTRTPQREMAPQFSADGRALQFRAGNDWFVYTLASGVTAPAAVLRAEQDPEAKQPDDLGRLQLRLFKTLREIKADRDALRAREEALDHADATRAARPFHLGDDVQVMDTELSPNGRWMLVVTAPKNAAEGRKPELMRYVTESGYAETEKTRTYVDRDAPASQSLRLLDLASHASYALSTDGLPGIKDDPLKALRAKAIAALTKDGHADEAKALEAPKLRPVRIVADAEDGGGGGIVWSEDGEQLAIQLRAIDNKDRWIATVDFGKHALVPQHRLHDDAWINWNFNDFGFLKDGRTLWYLSEESGWSQLYEKALDARKAHALTEGRFEVSHPALSPDGKWFYLRTNREAPYSYDVYRLPAGGGTLTRVTAYQGMDDFALSPDGTRLAVLHSAPYLPPQLAVVNADGSGVRELTDTRTAEYKALQWVEPQFVGVPSTHDAGTIYAKFYKPAGYDASKPHPAVIFVHGAGYTQDVDHNWSYYFREQMFHNLLLAEGYVVLDMDYRASEGYGRAWRTAIYRQMGHPELEDLLDGKAWLVKNQAVDPKRVGIYGGSYGGFMTLIALLRAPGEFAAGAALRPVTDWTTYNHEYTSNILDDPRLDPEAYRISSPIEYAENLRDPLLICHGLIDNNVLTSDSIRLYQRFIELHKDNFWLSLYPLDRHGFVHADSWYDEYRRIHELFTRYLRPGG